MKKEKIVFGSMCFLGILLYFFTESSYASIFLIGICIYGIVAYITSRISGKQIEVSFSGEKQCEKGKQIEIVLHTKNNSKIPIWNMEIVLSVKNKLTGEQLEVKKEFSLFILQEKQDSFYLESQFCGCIEISIERIRISDLFGVFIKERTIHMENQYYVFPKLLETDFTIEQLNQYNMESYKYSPLKSGDDTSETFGIREYKEGDRLKAIHWKLTGKMENLIVREAGLPIENSVMILLDKRECEEISADQKDKLTEIFLSLSNTIMKNGIHHAIGWYNYEREKFEQYRIQSTEDIYMIIAELLSSPYCKDEISTVDRFIESDTGKEYSNYLYVTESNVAERETEKLMTYGNVEIYRAKAFN
ncbi:DUF58 domain-containing protein [Faecalimonas sp.]